MLQLFVCTTKPEAIMMTAKRFCMNKKHSSQSRNFTHREVQLQKSSLSPKDKQEKNPDFPGSRAKHQLPLQGISTFQTEIKK